MADGGVHGSRLDVVRDRFGFRSVVHVELRVGDVVWVLKKVNFYFYLILTILFFLIGVKVVIQIKILHRIFYWK